MGLFGWVRGRVTKLLSPSKGGTWVGGWGTSSLILTTSLSIVWYEYERIRARGTAKCLSFTSPEKLKGIRPYDDGLAPSYSYNFLGI